MFGDNLHPSPNVAPLQSDGPHQLGAAIGSHEVDLGLAVAKHMNVRGFVIVHEDNDFESVSAQDGDHSSQ